MRIKNEGFDHVEFVVGDIASHALMYQRAGFEKIGERKDSKRKLKSEVWAQGLIRVILSQYEAGATEEGARFHREHGDGISVLALDVVNAAETFEEVVKRGAKPAMKPQKFESSQGTVVRAEVFTPADVRYAFIERKSPGGSNRPALFDENLIVDRLESPTPFNLWKIDHLTNNINMGETRKWVDFYTQVFDFKVVRHFDIRTGRTGLTSEVVQSQDGSVKVPINEATEPESQVQEFVNRFKGAGVQHLAFLSTGILKTLPEMKKSGFKFLTVPHTYYEVVPKRVPGVIEDLKVLESLGVLLDGESGNGYLMQTFTEEMVGPFFFEVIERKGDQGFGEGNFRALFEAIERDQIRRGVLSA